MASGLSQKLRSTFRDLFARKREEQSLEAELRFDLEERTRAHIAAGLSAEDAKFAAISEFGSVSLAMEESRDARRTHFLETLIQDLRYGLRGLRRNPGFTAVAVLTLALGIGANTAIFSIVNAILLKPLPFPNSDQLVVISETNSRVAPGSVYQGYESYLNFLDWQHDARSFSAMAAYQYSDMALTGAGEPTVIHGAITNSGLFSTLQSPPLLGRALEPQDDPKGAARVVVIGEQFWRRQLAADPAILGKTLHLDRQSFTIVGVMPDSFRFPDADTPLCFWLPIEQSPNYASFVDSATGRDFFYFFTIARLKPGVTYLEAESEMGAIVHRLAEQYNLDLTTVAHIESLKRKITGDVRPALLVLLGAVGLVVLIACANIANLLLARATGRAREIALRFALGAGRARIVRQLFTESILLGVCAGAAGLLLAYWGVRGIASFASGQIPHIRAIGVDSSMLFFTLALSIFAGVLFGLAPAWQSSSIDVNEVLRESGRGSTGTASRGRTRSVLVVVEVALAIVLLIGSGLLLKSFYLLTRTNPGFDPQHVLKGDVSLPQSQYTNPPQRAAFFREAVERLKSIPGVEYAAATLPIPFSLSNNGYNFSVEGEPAPSHGQEPIAAVQSVTADYFRVMRVPLLRGRVFEESDSALHSGAVVVISQQLAREFFPNKDAVGQSLKIFGFPAPYVSRIVGVVDDVKARTLADVPKPTIYLPYTQESWFLMSFVVRTTGDPASAAGPLQTQIHSLDPALPVQEVRPLAALITDSEGDARFRSVLLGLFGALALVLATVGIYGVLAYLVAQRTHELGIRVALGAQRVDVLRLVVGQGIRTVLVGIATGVAAALALSQLLAGFLYGVSAKDPATFAGVSTLLTLIALLACYIPARRATHVDPIIALRHD